MYEETQPQRNLAFEKWVRDGRDAKQLQRMIAQSKRAILACQRSGTVAQLVAEEANLKLYLANEPAA